MNPQLLPTQRTSYGKQTKRLIHLAPILSVLNSITLVTICDGASTALYGLYARNTFWVLVGLLIPILGAWFRGQIEDWLRHQRYRRSAIVLSFVSLSGLVVAVFLIGDPLLAPLALVLALMPILLGVIYDLGNRPAFFAAAISLYCLLIIGLLVPLPTRLVLNNFARVLLVLNVLFLGISQILNAYRILQNIFDDHAHESERRLEMLRVLEADLTLRNAQLEQAVDSSEQANVTKTQFLQNMSHELRSPLNSVIGLSEIIAEDLEAFPPEMVKEQARQIYKAGQHLLSVISDVLDIAKIESGTFQVYYEPVDTLAIIKDLDAIIVGLRARWPEVQFTLEVPDSLPTILAEDRRIRQILINLLDNAFKYTRKGEVSMRASADEEGIIVAVQDSGIGISKENYARIFEPFEQVAGKQAIGTGLGLAITRHLVLEHGGILDVESEPGHGSKFSVFLPKADLDFPVKGRGNVLVIDNDKNLLKVLVHQLARAGYSPITASAPDDAREVLQQQQLTAVILDLFLPAVDIGLHFFDELTSRNAPWNCPVVVYSSAKESKRLPQTGVIVIEKPVRPFRLISALHDAIREVTIEEW